MTKIKFGTDGWRAIIAQEFTVDNVARVAEGTAKWLLKSSKTPEIMLGHDCRFAGALFCETVAKVMCSLGVKVYLAKDFVSTPMISLGTVKLKKDLGIIITASHNPPDQCAVIKVALHFLKKGGILIVEDIFRERSIEPYEKIFEEVKDLVSFHTFITCDHALRYSPGWNNDKLLVFVKN